ncbi:uncharacterized protein UMAG_04308 [Mycosarcoma maydis]|uniref:Uncharacterized protein n=1 Tax=Mycosarcoma maydis TaxID=5270 RepID=A0A0D1DTS0_MYCMD|nr:uncharacterized protein UMAG_04308 [Ustilago maydis 521]KIS67201.1 hypothetical protein UMAG_04308 [Ustilago maydis 521]|eukprot:XP_011391031.1 hypothetical protein UMAG_04308 [Ustilago maydis 521]
MGSATFKPVASALCENTCMFTPRRPSNTLRPLRSGAPASFRPDFTAKGIIDYFEVDDAVPIHPQQTARLDPSCTISTLASTSAATSTPTRTEDGRAAIFEDVKGEIEAHFEPARRAQDPLRANARADREPWLVNTGFGAHLDGLLDAEIRSSYALPSSVDAELVLDDAPEDASNSDLQRILVAAEHTLRDAYRLCSDTSARYKLTQQRAIALSQFRLGDASEEPNSRGSYLRRFKNERTLVNYFRLTKQLLTYYYRVVYRRDGHFTSNTEGHSLPQDVIKPSAEQLEAMNAIIEVLRQQDALDNAMAMNEEEDYDYHLDAEQLDARAELDEQLKKAIRELLVSVMSCAVGSPIVPVGVAELLCNGQSILGTADGLIKCVRTLKI